MPLDIQNLPADSINTKWKEPYASASLNRRPVGITPPGIYRGLILAEDPATGDRTVLVQADSNKGDHVAVFENEDGYSVNYRDGASGDIVISLAGYTSVDVVVTIFIDYQVGADTIGTFRSFTESEFTALPSGERDALVVLGTVSVGAASAPIPAGDISLNRRTLASTNLQKGAVLNAPVIRNAGFEIGAVNESYARSSLFWEKIVSSGSGSWLTSTVQANEGLKSIQLNITSGPIQGELVQQLGIQTTAGELFLVEISVWQIKETSSGQFRFFIEWADSNDDLLATSYQDLDAGIDSGWRELAPIFSAPVGATSVKAAGIRCDALDPASTGVFAYIDQVQILIEPNDPQLPYPFEQSFRQNVVASSVSLVDKGGNFDDKSPLMTYDASTPVGEGSVVVGSGDETVDPVTMDILGRFSSIGSSLVGTLANALRSRVTTPTATAAVSTFTLLWEAQQAGGSGAMRFYSDENGQLIATSNARWTGSNWVKDASGATAARISLSGTGSVFDVKFQEAGVNLWVDGAWTATVLQIDGLPTPQVTIDDIAVINGKLTANAGIDIDNSDLTVNTGGITVNTGDVIVNTGNVEVDGEVRPNVGDTHDLASYVDPWAVIYGNRFYANEAGFGSTSVPLLSLQPPTAGNGPGPAVVARSYYSGTPNLGGFGDDAFMFIDCFGLIGHGHGCNGSVNWAKGGTFNGWTTVTNGGGTVTHGGDTGNLYPAALLEGNGAGGYARFISAFPYFNLGEDSIAFRALVEIESGTAGSEYAVGFDTSLTGSGYDLDYGFQIDTGVQGNNNVWLKYGGAHVVDTGLGLGEVEKFGRIFMWYGIFQASTASPVVIYALGYNDVIFAVSEYHAGSAASTAGHRAVMNVENDGAMRVYQFDWYQGLEGT